MIAYYGHDISPNITETDEGYLICRNVPIARTGPQEYTARELQLDGDPERLIAVNRHPEDIFTPAALASFEGKPVTDGHPPEDVGSANYAAYTRGHVQNVRQVGDYIVADLYINDANLASEVRNGVKREISCGYLFDCLPDGDTFKQANIRGNHVAVVPRGRAGHAVAIQDHAAEAAPKGLKKDMIKEWKTAMLKAFAGSASAEGVTDEQLDQMARMTITALDADPAENSAPAAAPAEDEAPKADPEPAAAPAQDEVVYKEQEGVDLGTKIDKLLSMMEKLTAGKDAGADEQSMTAGETIDALVDELGGDACKAATVDASATDSMSPAARDAATAMLKALRPIVAGMSDKAEQKRVTDALVGIVRGNGNIYGDIARAAQDSAQNAAKQSAQTRYDRICEDAQAAYDELNPHRRKEG